MKKKSDKGRKLKLNFWNEQTKLTPFVSLFQNKSILSCGDLDIGDIDVILSCDTPSHDGEQMCQMILKSHNEWHSYGQDKLIYGHFWPLNSKCDLDLGDIDVIISRDTPSNDGEQMCQMILKSDNERHSYGPDKLVLPASQPASPPAFANVITSFFLRKTWLKSCAEETDINTF